MAADRGKRPRDERGRFVRKGDEREPKRSAKARGSKSAQTQAKANAAGASGKAKAKAASSEAPPRAERAAPEPRAESEQRPAAGREQVGSPSDQLGDESGADLDAMGLDKRRHVVGGSYGPGIAKQMTVYGAFLAVVAALVIGSIIAINELDQPRDRDAPEAPWAQPEAEQLPPRPLDFPRSGQTEVN